MGAADPVNFGQYDMGLSLSGPIRQDRLWFFAAYNPTSATQDAVFAAIPKTRDPDPSPVCGEGDVASRDQDGLFLTVVGDP